MLNEELYTGHGDIFIDINLQKDELQSFGKKTKIQ